MRRIVLLALGAFAAWTLVTIGVGLYYAADGGHGGKPSVELAAVALALVLLVADAVVMRRLWKAGRRGP